jgi:hypothetical protein
MILASAVLSPIVESTCSYLCRKLYVSDIEEVVEACWLTYSMVEYPMKDRCHYLEMRQCMAWLLQIFRSINERAEPITFSGLERR